MSTQTVTAFAGPIGRVEREVSRRQLVEADVVEGASEVLAEHDVLGGIVDEIDCRDSVGQLQRSLDRVVQAAPDALFENETVDDDVDVVLVITIEPDLLGQVAASPSMRARANPLRASSSSAWVNSPLRPLTIGSQHLKPGSLGRSRTWSTICSGVCRAMGLHRDGSAVGRSGRTEAACSRRSR